MRAGLVALGLAAAGGTAQAEEFETRIGVDWMVRDQSPVEAFQYLMMSKEIANGFYLGQSVYSAAWGDAGGLFIGGFDAFKRFQITDSTSIDIGAFVGGGGGAVVVLGDGLMTKPQVTLNQAFASGYMASIGLGWTRVTGSSIDTPSLSFAVSRSTDLALETGNVENRPAAGIVLSAAKGVGRYYYPFDAGRRRNPGQMDPMALVGAEFTFRDLSVDWIEGYIAAVGAVHGDGAGYAEWTAGPRVFTPAVLGGRVRGFADVGVGFSGGGDVDTGGGLIVTASAGVDVGLWGGVHAEAGVMGLHAVTGDYTAAAAFLRGAIHFDQPARETGAAPARHWQFTTGLSYQFENPGYRPAGHAFSGNDVLLAETGADLFVTDWFYVNGSAYTVLDGMAGGFAMGTAGLGVTFPLGGRVALSGELFGGAAAGGGIDTGGGLIWGGKAELDYKLSDRLTLSAGAGKWYSRGGAQPWTLHGAVKIPFTTLHGF